MLLSNQGPIAAERTPPTPPGFPAASEHGAGCRWSLDTPHLFVERQRHHCIPTKLDRQTLDRQTWHLYGHIHVDVDGSVGDGNQEPEPSRDPATMPSAVPRTRDSVPAALDGPAPAEGRLLHPAVWLGRVRLSHTDRPGDRVRR